jgi:hypothetical protein
VSDFYHFHVNLFPAPRSTKFDNTWEHAAAKLEQLPRMIFELDGSFVVTGDDEVGRRWQVDGHLFDFAGRLHRVELHGRCPSTAFDQLMHCVGWPEQELTFEMVREGDSVDEVEFRRRASSTQ